MPRYPLPDQEVDATDMNGRPPAEAAAPSTPSRPRPSPGGVRLGRLLDRVGAACALFDADGRHVYTTAVLDRLLGAEPQSDAVLDRIGALAEAVGEDAPAETGHVGGLRRYALRATHEPVPGSLPIVLVTVEAGPRRPAARHGLTPRQTEVAELLARRLTNAEVAEALSISPHTARHHTEAVLRKLGLRDRRHVAEALRRLDGP